MIEEKIFNALIWVVIALLAVTGVFGTIEYVKEVINGERSLLEGLFKAVLLGAFSVVICKFLIQEVKNQ